MSNSTTRSNRPLPHAYDAERAFLSSLLIQPGLILMSGAEARDFFTPAHATIYGAICKVAEEFATEAVDIITVTNVLKASKEIEAVGGPGAVAEIFDAAPSAGNWQHYLGILKEHRERRDFILKSMRAQSRAYDMAVPIEDVRGECAGALREMALQQNRDAFVSIADAMQALSLELTTPEMGLGLSTGYPNLDNLIGGFRPGQKILFTGPTKGGKSSLVHNIAINLGRANHKTLIFSFEMDAVEYAERIAQTLSGVSALRIRQKKATEDEQRKFMLAMQVGARLPIKFVDTMCTCQEVYAMSAAAAAEGTKIVVIDHINEHKEPFRQGERSHDRLERITAGHKQMARELGVTVLELAQETFNEETGRVSGKGCSHIQQSCDKWIRITGNGEQKKIVLQVQRAGDTGEVKFRFFREQTKFVEEEWEELPPRKPTRSRHPEELDED